VLKAAIGGADTRAGQQWGGWVMRCPSCSKGSVIEIRMRINGEELTFRRCGRCEAKSWTTADRDVPLSHVLELAKAT
jgi:hypothetical protein